MRLISFILLFFITSLFAQTNIDAWVYDLSKSTANITPTKSDFIHFNEIPKRYNLNKSLPTVIITWFGSCTDCKDLYDRYNSLGKDKINLIMINMAPYNQRNKTLYHLSTNVWKNALHFAGSLPPGYKGFNKIFSTKRVPLLITLDSNGTIIDIRNDHQYFPFLMMVDNDLPIEFVWNSYKDLNTLAWEIYKNSDDLSFIQEAITYAKRSIEIKSTYDNLDTYAALLYKTGDYTKALKTAKMAIKKAKETGKSSKTTSELINKIIDKM